MSFCACLHVFVITLAPCGHFVPLCMDLFVVIPCLTEVALCVFVVV